MARIRTIKPEFPQSESMGRVSRDARLTFIQLWTLADDEGRLRGNSRMLASLLFPYDDDAQSLIEGWLGELEQEQCLVRYKIGGTSYIQITNWLIHQKIDKPSKSKIPAFDESSRILANPREMSSLDQGSRTKDQGVDQKEPYGSVDSGEKASPTADLLGDCEGNGSTGERSATGIPPCPVQQIVDLYHAMMPINPRVRVLDDARKKAIRARWKQAAELQDVGPFGYSTGQEGLSAWKKFFEVCAESDFLTGKAKAQPGKPPFLADIDFLMSPSGFKKALENKYHREVKE
ncbi:hypothetical protein L0Z36_05420 [Burkholderia multivorans]|uniref:hypothetical protein n=1 Tax=Burkholderia multivorans TaxID=87883 RepID=UPI000D0094D3|nr:hypothetical protein [Burkholderia multivorans]PRE27552.1 hypothetical protein C6P79_14615 [Burkholderia multivorans]QGR60411.1 hypothetical protein FOC27_09345 [Burkholderia multivorans]UQP01374.1 hypothetical protein L0Z36_05420 [Burkholderia multivorans]